MFAKYNGKKYVIEGEKVVLAPVKKSELSLFVKWFSDKRISKYLAIDYTGMTLEKEEEWFKRQQTLKSDVGFGIHYKENSKKVLVGSTSIKDINFEHMFGEYGIIIGDKNYWGKGIGSEVTRLMIDFALTKVKLNSLMLYVDEKNKAGQKAYKKAGFRISGRLRKHHLRQGKYYDTIIMDILRKEYKRPKDLKIKYKIK